MASSFILTLDTVAPLNPSLIFPAGSHTPVQVVDVAISTTDPSTVGYEMKIWGDVDLTFDANVQDSEINSSWIAYSSLKEIKLSAGEGSKTVYLILRDDVYNETIQVFSSITFDSTTPIVNIVVGPDVTRISKVVGKNECNFGFQSVEIFIEYKVKTVPNAGSAHTDGTTIGTTGGSSNMSGTGTFPAITTIDSVIIGDDLETSSPGDGQKIVKIFVKDQAGNWST